MLLEKRKRLALLAIFLLILNASTTVTQAYHVGKQTKTILYGNPGDFLPKKIAILYDPYNPKTKETARSIDETISFLYNNVELIEIYYPALFRKVFREDYWIQIYIFDSDLEGIKFAGWHLQWKNLSDYFNFYTDRHHVAVFGNSYKVSPLVTNSYCYFEQAEVLDVRVGYLHAIWSVSEIFESEKDAIYREIGKQLKFIAIKYFGDSFEDLLSAEFEPKYGLGVEDPEKARERLEDSMRRYPTTLYRVDPDTGKFYEPTATIPNHNPILDLKPRDAAEDAGDIILGNFPDLSSISGAAGDVINALLSVIGVKIPNGVITLAAEYADEIKTIIAEIPKIIGILKDPTSSSALEALFDVLKAAFPSLEEYKPYFDIATKAIFAIREGKEGIIDLAKELILFLVPESARDIVADTIEIALNLTETFFDKMKEFDNWGDFLMSWLNKQLLNLIMEKFVSFIPGLNDTAQEIQDIANKLTTIFKMGVDIISSKNITYVVKEVLPYLAQNLLGSFLGDEGEKTLNLMGIALELGLGAAGVIDVKYEDALKDLLKILFPDIVETAEEFKQTVDEIIDLVKEVVENRETIFNNVKTQLINYLTDIDTYSSLIDLTEGQKDVIARVLALAMKLLNEEFEVPSTENLISLIEDIIDNFFSSVSPDTKEIIKETIDLASSLVAFVTDSDKIKSYVKGTVENFINEYSNPSKLVELVFQDILPLFGGELNITLIQEVGEIVGYIVELFTDGFDFSVQNVLQTIVNVAAMVLPKLDEDIPFDIAKKIFDLLWSKKPELSNVKEIVTEIINIIDPLVPATIKNAIELVLTFLGSAKQLFKDGIKWIINQVVGWLAGKIADLLNTLTDKLNQFFQQIGDFASFSANFSVSFGSFSAFSLGISFALSPGFAIDKEAIQKLVMDLVFHASKLFDISNLGHFFKNVLKAINIIPLFKAALSVNSGTSGKNDLVKHLLDSLGLELAFSGSAGLTLQLFKIANGQIKLSDFFKVIEFFFKFELTLSKRFPLAEFFFGPAVSALAKVAEYIGLGGIFLEISFKLGIEIVKRCETPTQKAADILKIIIGIGVSIIIDISLVVVGITIVLGFTVTLTFVQDFMADAPLQVILEILLTLKVKLTFLLWDWSKTVSWGPDPIYLAGGKDDPETRDEMSGLDEDEDGLPDAYEMMIPGLDVNAEDSDGDGLTDKFEISTSNTDPIVNDTDGDGLDDGFEYTVLHTNPLQKDTDFDGLDDYQEVMILGTDAKSVDTDGDGLDDYYEVNTAWNMTDCTPNVPYVIIGGKKYTDHTDPLNPDTDGDGLLDGEEGPFGGYYGPDLYPSASPDQPPIIRNNGYTHPLDNDTDDDSYRLLYNGTIAPDRYFYMPMTDKIEIEGQWVIFIEEDELVPRLVRTNPCNPDSDGDTGIRGPEDRGENAPINLFLNSDGKELWLDPPTDPNDADMDDDGIIDGLEGWGKPESNHTDPRNPDTDGDGLGDLQDILLGSDPLNPDSDQDGVLDGDEFFKYGTNPALEDTDGDGLLDGEELYLYHTNPLAVDSDGDGLEDGMEVLYYNTNPMDEDEDNDGLTDWEEIFYYNTEPKVYDSDNDGLSDYEEVMIYFTDPLNWDSDNDTLWYPNEYGEYTFPLSDGDEVKRYGTDPLSSDTDGDGIYDSMELYLGSGLIPNFTPIPLDPTSNDTDADGVIDSLECRIANITDIIYPYRSFIITAPFNTSAVNPDTDGDGLTDGEEIYGVLIDGQLIRFGTMPNMTDTDGDGLTDYQEIFGYGTDPVTSDTDGDGLNDTAEVMGYYAPYTLDPNDPDVDDDLLPDGAEILFYNTNPNVADENNNGKIDGMDYDADQDGLEDGLEFFVYHTPMLPGGGVTQPDSDRDGLSDGSEVYLYGTNCSYWDTDNDTYSDGLEVMLGTDPLNATSEEEIMAALEEAEHGLIVISPLDDGKYAPANYTFIIYNATPVDNINYTLQRGEDVLVANRSMDFDDITRTWIATGDVLSPGDYKVTFYVYFVDGNTTEVTREFTVVSTGASAGTWIGVGTAIGAGTVGITGALVYYFIRRGFPFFKKGGGT